MNRIWRFNCIEPRARESVNDWQKRSNPKTEKHTGTGNSRAQRSGNESFKTLILNSCCWLLTSSRCSPSGTQHRWVIRSTGQVHQRGGWELEKTGSYVRKTILDTANLVWYLWTERRWRTGHNSTLRMPPNNFITLWTLFFVTCSSQHRLIVKSAKRQFGLTTIDSPGCQLTKDEAVLL